MMPHEPSPDLIDLLGFSILIVSAAVAFISLLNWRSRKTKHPVGFGVSMTLFFMTAYFMADTLLRSVPGPMRGIVDPFIATMAWLSVGFTADRAMKAFVWYGRLKYGERSVVPDLLIDLVTVAIYATALLVVSSLVFHRDITAIAATSGVVAIVIGYSAQSTLAEVFAGLALNLSRPFRLGDSVQVDNIWGVILEAGWRSVSLRTYEGNLVVLPNSKAASMRLINLDLPQHHTRHAMPFVMEMDVPPSRVREVAMEAMLSVPHVMRTPSPMVLVKNITDEGMAYEAIFWQADPNTWVLRQDEVGGALWYAFRRAGLPFAVRRHDMALPAGATPPVPFSDPAAEVGEALEALRKSPLFQSFPEEALAELASRQRHLMYGEPERIVGQGDAGSSMFLILQGRAAVFHLHEDGTEHKVATLGPGQSFGHMSLMTGEPRSATVRADSHLVLAEIQKHALTPLLDAHPAAIETIAGEIIKLQAANEELRAHEDHHEGTTAEVHASVLGKLVGRMRHFFGK